MRAGPTTIPVILAGGGGEQGASVEEATRPKPSSLYAGETMGQEAPLRASTIAVPRDIRRSPMPATQVPRTEILENHVSNLNLLSWNCRGCGNSRTIRDLVSLVQVHSPTIVFLCETRQRKVKMKRYRSRLGLSGFEAVNSNGLSGGLALFWHESVQLDVKDMNEQYIDAYVSAATGEPPWRLTCVYGEP